MNTSTFAQLLAENPNAAIYIMLPDGDFIPDHFHITEIGRIHKQYIDCGATYRESLFCSLQVWVANDKDHRLTSAKLIKVLNSAEQLLIGNPEMMVEYGKETISQYYIKDIEVHPEEGLLVILSFKPTACLAPDKCGVKGCC